MSQLRVDIDYIKLAQYVAVIDKYLRQIKNELDRAVVERKDIENGLQQEEEKTRQKEKHS
jgi:hypothetical protein